MYSCTFFCSVVCRLLSVTFVPLLKSFNRLTCYLAGTVVGCNDALCHMGVPEPKGKGKLGVEPPARTWSFYL